jgi:hypothetical protein
LKTSFKLFAAILLMACAAHAGVTISSPANGSTVGTPLRIVANANSSYPIVHMKVYVDNNVAYSTNANYVDTYISVASGWRYIVVQAWDSAGGVQKQAVNVNIAYVTQTQPITSSGISVSSPANGSTVGSPVRVAASSAGATAMSVYVDNNLAYSVKAASFDTGIAMAGGTRQIVIQSWDSAGVVRKQALTVNVSGSTATAPVGNVIGNIEQLSGWEHCDSCAGIGGSGPQIPYSYSQGRVDPSMDGNSMEFWIGGTTPYANALWWKQLGARDGATNFVYDMHFYMKDPNASQALEFDVNQSVNGRKFIWGTECNIAETKTWRIWDPAAVRWVNSGIPCAKPAAYKWNRLVWEFRREGNYVVYVSVTLNGQKTYVNRSFLSLAVNARELNVAFQMDGNHNQTDYSVWLDRVTLNYW